MSESQSTKSQGYFLKALDIPFTFNDLRYGLIGNAELLSELEPAYRDNKFRIEQSSKSGRPNKFIQALRKPAIERDEKDITTIESYKNLKLDTIYICVLRDGKYEEYVDNKFFKCGRNDLLELPSNKNKSVLRRKYFVQAQVSQYPEFKALPGVFIREKTETIKKKSKQRALFEFKTYFDERQKDFVEIASEVIQVCIESNYWHRFNVTRSSAMTEDLSDKFKNAVKNNRLHKGISEGFSIFLETLPFSENNKLLCDDDTLMIISIKNETWQTTAKEKGNKHVYFDPTILPIKTEYEFIGEQSDRREVSDISNLVGILPKRKFNMYVCFYVPSIAKPIKEESFLLLEVRNLIPPIINFLNEQNVWLESKAQCFKPDNSKYDQNFINSLLVSIKNEAWAEDKAELTARIREFHNYIKGFIADLPSPDTSDARVFLYLLLLMISEYSVSKDAIEELFKKLKRI